MRRMASLSLTQRWAGVIHQEGDSDDGSLSEQGQEIAVQVSVHPQSETKSIDTDSQDSSHFSPPDDTGSTESNSNYKDGSYESCQL